MLVYNEIKITWWYKKLLAFQTQKLTASTKKLKTSLVADNMAEFISNAAIKNAGRTSAILKRIYEKKLSDRKWRENK
jgi:hypothetical protein